MIDKLKEQPDAGDQVPKGQWPSEYRRIGFTNIFRFEVDDSLRATYTVRSKGSQKLEVAMIELFNSHKEYEKRFNY